MKKKKTISLKIEVEEMNDEELTALVTCSREITKLCFDQKWRVFHYLLARHMGRSWALVKPLSG